MPAAVHLYRQKRRQEARLHGQAAVLSGGFRHRHFCLHELPDLRRGLPVRSHQDGQRIRIKPARTIRRLAPAQEGAVEVERLLPQDLPDRCHPSRCQARRSRGEKEAGAACNTISADRAGTRGPIRGLIASKHFLEAEAIELHLSNSTLLRIASADRQLWNGQAAAFDVTDFHLQGAER